MPIRVLHVGLGPIGLGVVRQVVGRKGLTVVGAVDLDPGKVGRDLGDVAELGRKLRLTVSDDVDAAIRATKPDVAVLCTSSSIAKLVPQIAAVVKRRVPIVSTTEELAYPVKAHRRYARQIDELAKKGKVAVLGTGGNPGFVMDALPIMLTGVCESVQKVHVDRIQDARIRRLPFQQKIGSGLTPATFHSRVEAGRFATSAWPSDHDDRRRARLDLDRSPTRSSEDRRKAISSQFLNVEAGQVCGLIQDGVGYRDGEPVITLHMEAYLGAPESYDAVRIEGTPPLRMKLAGGVHGDIATASITVNSIPRVMAATPGLHTMRSLPLPSFFGGKLG